MNTQNPKTPGVYINELNAFPNSVVPVATAIPAFIGYTPRAEYEGKSYLNKPQKVTSFAEFKSIYMLPDLPVPAEPVKQYKPQYYLLKQKAKPSDGEYLLIGETYYSIQPDPSTIYYLYNSIRLFYENGGGEAYIVSVGGYGPVGNTALASASDQIVNPNVTLDALKAGLNTLINESEPTMYICPEATLLSLDDNSTLMQLMLAQASGVQTAVCIFDVIGGRNPDPIKYTDDINRFRNSTGSSGLKYGISYYPFVCTTTMQPEDIDYTNLFGGDTKQLHALLNPPSSPNAKAASILSMIETPTDNPLTVAQYNAALVNASGTYKLICEQVLNQANVLPPSGGMAGIYTNNDNSYGVWNLPANVSMISVVDLPIKLSASEQAPLNVDAVSGKSINALRFFNGQGFLVWAARTLDGNSNDWRYISVRRTMTMLEQSCKLAARQYIFEPNDANTWSGIENMISSFLTGIWKEGGLQGATAADAFEVNVGLGTTMTPEDILNGHLRVIIKVAVTHPAEFLLITLEQKMLKS